MKQFHEKQFFVPSIGTFRITCCGDCITAISAERNGTKAHRTETQSGCALCENAVRELKEYFQGLRTNFDLPLQLNGSDLQLRVWNYLRNIPYGSTVSYSQVAEDVGCRSVRAVATVIGRNPIPIIIPCHRVIRKNGVIGKFSLIGPEVKKQLIDLEQNHCAETGR